MTISTEANRKSYAGNGTTTAFSFPYWFKQESDLVVLLVNDTTQVAVTQVLSTDYTVTGAGNPAGGTVTMVTAPASGETLVIYRDPDLKQSTDLINGGPFDQESVEGALDKITTMVQRNRDLAERSFRLPDGDTSGIDCL